MKIDPELRALSFEDRMDGTEGSMQGGGIDIMTMGERRERIKK